MSEEKALVPTSKISELEVKAQPIVSSAKEFKITNDQEFQEAGHRLRDIKNFLSEANNLFDPQIEATNRAHKISVAQKKKFTDPLLAADKIYRRLRSDYELALERKAEEERARIVAEEKEKRRLEKEIPSGDVGGPSLSSNLSSTIGIQKTEEASADMDLSLAFAIAPHKPKDAEGLRSNTDYEVEVTDPFILIQALASGDIPIDLDKLITWKISSIKAYIKESGREEIPGVRVERKKVSKVY